MSSEKKILSVIVLAITLLVAPLNYVTAANTGFSALDNQIKNIRDLYSLADGWNLSLRAPSSLSSQNAYLLSQVNKRWSKYRLPINKYSQEVNSFPNGLILKDSVITDIKKRHGAGASSRIAAWQRISNVQKNLSLREKLALVNNFFNRLEFKSDQNNWGVKDYWTSPIEFLISNSGDCEDYAIAKYMTLISMGVGAENLRITYVKATDFGQAHMVLAYYETLNKVPLILDNLNSNILPATKRPDLIPVYGFNG